MPIRRRYDSEQDILAAIEKARELAQRALEQSNLELDLYKASLKHGKQWEGVANFHKAKSDQCLKRHAYYLETKLIALKEKLAEMRTPLLFEGMDKSISGRLRAKKK
jgi:hypothetical protein